MEKYHNGATKTQILNRKKRGEFKRERLIKYHKKNDTHSIILIQEIHLIHKKFRLSII